MRCDCNAEDGETNPSKDENIGDITQLRSTDSIQLLQPEHRHPGITQQLHNVQPQPPNDTQQLPPDTAQLPPPDDEAQPPPPDTAQPPPPDAAQLHPPPLTLPSCTPPPHTPPAGAAQPEPLLSADQPLQQKAVVDGTGMDLSLPDLQLTSLIGSTTTVVTRVPTLTQVDTQVDSPTYNTYDQDRLVGKVLKLERHIETIMSRLEKKNMEVELMNTEINTAFNTITSLQQRISVLENQNTTTIMHNVPDSPSPQNLLLFGDSNLRRVLSSDLGVN
ncbi:hypothetical protein Pmani_001312 [Petrolisthes manimaculis]|uniref:Uncharacterized protein n=1 Tax=Petrolisthes manimaculis TaxID=1843537 RepID=A0AAE1QNC9_9EUCA|nr:hypothetical protein Pmani_001312 [Petrolisthes manimaculis]